MERIPTETDQDAFRKKLRFIRKDDEGGADEDDRLTKAAKAFEGELFADFALADLSRYRNQQIGLRWRTARECQSGKGENSCGALDCAATDQLSRLELPFTYREGTDTSKTMTLVKVTLCPSCAEKATFIAKKGRKKKKRERRDGRTRTH